MHKKYFLNQSRYKIPENFMQTLENEFSAVSERRLRPLTKTKV